jgi:hypothetical protein
MLSGSWRKVKSFVCFRLFPSIGGHHFIPGHNFIPICTKFKKPKGTITFSLSTKGLANIPPKDSAMNFEFIAGDATYHCHAFAADFLSPLIANLHLIDDK